MTEIAKGPPCSVPHSVAHVPVASARAAANVTLRIRGKVHARGNLGAKACGTTFGRSPASQFRGKIHARAGGLRKEKDAEIGSMRERRILILSHKNPTENPTAGVHEAPAAVGRPGPGKKTGTSLLGEDVGVVAVGLLIVENRDAGGVGPVIVAAAI
jgi:hypothetical protein